MATNDETAQDEIQQLLSRLNGKIEDIETVTALLCAPLDSLRLLPPQFSRHNTTPLPSNTFSLVAKYLPQIQRLILEKIAPTWRHILQEEKRDILLDQYFCPDSFFFALPAAGNCSLCAYSTIPTLPLDSYAIVLLSRLSLSYPLDRLHEVVFSAQSSLSAARKSLAWEDFIRNLLSIPAKVSNHLQDRLNDYPPELVEDTFFKNVNPRLEQLIFTLTPPLSEDVQTSLSFLLTKLVNIGLFPTSRSGTAGTTGFFAATLPTMRSRLHSGRYSSTWRIILASLPSTSLSKILSSLFSNFSSVPNWESAPTARGLVKREALVAERLLGPLNPNADDDLWEIACAVMINNEWNVSRARIFTCWAAQPTAKSPDLKAMEALLHRALDVWASSDHVKHSLLSRHHYTTAILLLTIAYFPPNHQAMLSLSVNSLFISAVGTYISHMDSAVRECGVLTAEVVASRAKKTLKFGFEESEWAKGIRRLIEGTDWSADAVADDDAVLERETTTSHPPAARPPTELPSTPSLSRPSATAEREADSDDESLVGYNSSPPSSRSPSPTASELAEIEADPTLNIGIKKVRRPVYLADLGAMFREPGKADDPGEVDKIEVALGVAEELIRRKRGYGTELEENAVNLVYGLAGLQNNYELDQFDEKRQGALTALVACSPRNAAPAIIDEFFKNQYSSSQRFAMLNALAMGARELASLPVPTSLVPVERTAFPSKRLPLHLHKKYITAADQNTAVQGLIDGISLQAIESSRESAENKVPQVVRERQLRVRGPAKISEVVVATNPRFPGPAPAPPKRTTFTEVAAAYFVAPLIANFWTHLQDEQTREARTAGHERAYKGAGTGMILNTLVLSHFLNTLAVLMHAARHAPAYLAVLAPDALEVAVTLGTRRLSRYDNDKGDDDSKDSGGSESSTGNKEVSTLIAALDLTVIILDACFDIDGGRSLSLEHTSLLLGASEWGAAIMQQLEKGLRVEGEGSKQLRLSRAAASVVLKVDELTSKWKQSLIEFGFPVS